MGPVEVERTVRQPDNDVDSIYELLSKISLTQERHGNRVRELTEMVAAHDLRFDSVDDRLERLETGMVEVLQILRGQPPGT